MARIEELPADVRTFVRMYAWHRVDPVPWTRPRAALADSRVGLVATACMVAPGQPPFDAEQPGNDPTFRLVSSEIDPSTLMNTFPGQAFDHSGLRADANLLVPLDRLRDMLAAGEIGSISSRTVLMCGHITKPQRLIDEFAPQIAHVFVEDRADVVMLVPA